MATPQDEVQVRLELTPLRRGVLRFEGLRLARPDPLGLFRSFLPESRCRKQRSSCPPLSPPANELPRNA